MIKGSVIKERDSIFKPEFNYRKLDALNCSMIKLFDSDPVMFYEQYKLGKPRKDKQSTALTIGDLVDFYLLDCKGNEDEFNNRFDEKFALSDQKIGTSQAFELAKILFNETVIDMNPETKEIKTDFSTRFTRAYDIIQRLGYYKNKSEEKVLEDFNDKGYDYFQSLVDNYGKTVLDASLLDKAKRVAEKLRDDEFTKDVFCDCDDDIEYFPKFPIEWNYKDIKCKSELDILMIDHHNKIIYPKDLKTTYDNESFEIGYIKHQYYLQAAFYHLAVKEWAKTEGLEGYKIEPMEFIVGDTSSNNRRPIRYILSEGDLRAGLEGFEYNNNFRRGIEELVSDIIWAESNDTWDVSRDVFQKKGKVKLDIKYS